MKGFIGITAFIGYHIVLILRDDWSQDFGLRIATVPMSCL